MQFLFYFLIFYTKADYLISGGSSRLISDYTVLKNDGSLHLQKSRGLEQIGGGYYQWH